MDRLPGSGSTRLAYPVVMYQAQFVVPPYRVVAAPGELPSIYDAYRDHAVLAEEFDLTQAEQTACFFGVADQHCDWPKLVVAQRYEPAGWGFDPGILIVPQTDTVFIGAGTRLLSYRLAPVMQRLWIDETNMGFWSWAYHDNVVVMAAELELAAWSSAGVKLWATFVEPPWSYSVAGEELILDVMGEKSSFPLVQGPPPR